MSNKYIISIFIIFLSFSSIEAKENTNYIEIHSKDWFTRDAYYPLEKLLNCRPSQKTLIISTNPHFLKIVNDELIKPRKLITKIDHEIWFMLAFILHYDNQTDTIGFGFHTDVMKINSDYYEFDWELLNIISYKLPVWHKRVTEKLFLWNLEEELK